MWSVRDYGRDLGQKSKDSTWTRKDMEQGSKQDRIKSLEAIMK